jgi:hypothetical protein
MSETGTATSSRSGDERPPSSTTPTNDLASSRGDDDDREARRRDSSTTHPPPCSISSNARWEDDDSARRCDDDENENGDEKDDTIHLPSPSSSSIISFDFISSSVDVNDAGRNDYINDDDNDDNDYNDYPMGCTFSPDGSCVLTAMSASGEFRVYDTPWTCIARTDTAPSSSGGASSSAFDDDRHRRLRRVWKPSLASHTGGPPPPSSTSSYSWYPKMSSLDPSSSVFATCRGNSMPIHLVDAYTSQLRASYRPYNSVDAMEGPNVISFNNDGSKLYGTGFVSDRTIAIFDVSIPGRDGMIARLGKTRRSRDGQKGMPSALAFPGSGGRGSGVGGPSNVFAVGTYSPASIYIYDDRTYVPCGTIVLHGGLAVVGHGRAFARKRRRGGRGEGDAAADVGDDDYDDVGIEREDNDDNPPLASARVDWFHSRARGGVTQLAWAPCASSNPHVLFSASRHSDAVLSWDVRVMSGLDDGGGDRGGRRSRSFCGGLRSYSRGNGNNSTNQRLEFELDDVGRRMFVGSNDEGLVRIYDVSSGKLEGTLDAYADDAIVSDAGDGGGGVIGKRDAVNGLSYFPNVYGGGETGRACEGLLAVAIGSRRFGDVHSDVDDDDICRIDGRRRVEVRPPGRLQLHGMNTLGA